MPCDPPAGGWAEGRGETGPDDWMGLNRLTEHVRAQPGTVQRHLGGAPGWPAVGAELLPRRAWSTWSAPPVTSRRPGRASRDLPRQPLRAPGQPAAPRDLEQLAQRLRDTPTTPISAHPDVIENKVRVKVVALDPATVAVLDAAGRDAIILEEPLLQWLD